MINIKELKIDELKPFKDSPFEFREDEGFSQLLESISESGVISPIVVCERNSNFEIISGYRRVEACRRLNINVIPAIVKELSREEAIVLHVDSNFQRDKILPSEKAYGYKMKLEAMKRQGFRSDLTSDQPGRRIESAEVIANESDDSKSQVRRYIRLTFLIPELLKLVDEGRIAFTPAVEMSFLTEDEQKILVDEMVGADATPSLSQAQRIRKLSAENMLTHEAIESIISEEKGNQKDTLKIPVSMITKCMGKYADRKAMEAYVQKACEYYAKYLKKMRNRDAR